MKQKFLWEQGDRDLNTTHRREFAANSVTEGFGDFTLLTFCQMKSSVKNAILNLFMIEAIAQGLLGSFETSLWGWAGDLGDSRPPGWSAESAQKPNLPLTEHKHSHWPHCLNASAVRREPWQEFSHVYQEDFLLIPHWGEQEKFSEWRERPQDQDAFLPFSENDSRGL